MGPRITGRLPHQAPCVPSYSRHTRLHVSRCITSTLLLLGRSAAEEIGESWRMQGQRPGSLVEGLDGTDWSGLGFAAQGHERSKTVLDETQFKATIQFLHPHSMKAVPQVGGGSIATAMVRLKPRLVVLFQPFKLFKVAQSYSPDVDQRAFEGRENAVVPRSMVRGASVTNVCDRVVEPLQSS